MPRQLEISRYDLVDLIDERDYEIGAEVGVEHGHFSYYLLKHSHLNRLYSVDSYDGKWSELRLDSESLLREFGDRSKLMVASSREAAEQLFDLQITFDFIYIDASHKYHDVRSDINCWWPLLNSGGLMAGHDYCQAGAGVVRAVNEFASANFLEVNLTRETWATWMLFKKRKDA